MKKTTNKLSDLELFAMEITHTVEMFPSNQEVVFYGLFAPIELSLEEFAEKYKDFILKRYANQSK